MKWGEIVISFFREVSFDSKTIFHKLLLRASVAWLLSTLLLLAMPTALEAQFKYNITNGTVTVTGYTGPGGVVNIPATMLITNYDHSVTNLPVVSVGQSAFIGLSTLTSVTIAGSVTNIGHDAFGACHNLASLTISNGVNNIGQNAFLLCTSLTNATIPMSVDSIGLEAFGGCRSMLAITVDPQNTFYSSTNGVLFDKNQTTLLQFPCGLGGSYTIPATVTNVGQYAFSGPANLTSVIIPSNVTTVGNDAFGDCSSLTNVTMLDGVANIGQGAFYDCESLSSLTIPNTVTNVGYAAFGLCFSLPSVNIPGSLASIGQNAFDECYGLTNVIISNGVISIEDWAFYNCTNLSDMTIPGSVTNISWQAFYNCADLLGIFFNGNAPATDSSAFAGDTNAIVYYLPGTTGWSNLLAGLPTLLWNPQPQTRDDNFGLQASQFDFNITGTTNIPIVVEASTKLADGPWAVLQSCNLTNGLLHFSDPQWTNNPSRFYRIRSP